MPDWYWSDADTAAEGRWPRLGAGYSVIVEDKRVGLQARIILTGPPIIQYRSDDVMHASHAILVRTSPFVTSLQVTATAR
jgi:hypothetical protein